MVANQICVSQQREYANMRGFKCSNNEEEKEFELVHGSRLIPGLLPPSHQVQELQ